MLWLYFVRDFYRAANVLPAPKEAAVPVSRAEQPQKNHQVKSTELATIVHRFSLRTPEVAAAEAAAPAMSAHLQRLSIESDHAFGVWDEAVGFSVFSANFERVTGLLSGACAGHGWIHAIHHDQQYAMNETLLRAVQGINGRCLVQAIGTEDDWRWLMIDVKAPTPQQPHIMVLWRDLTEQKALEEALKQVEASLVVSERGRSAFLSSMSHELRTPLNAIMGFSEMMKSGVFGDLSNDTYQQYTKHIHDSGSILLQKVNDLLDIASMDAGAVEVEDTVFYVQALFEDAIAIHSHDAFARGITLRTDCAPTLEMRGDRAKLICAISHLLSNAMRHSDENGEITLSGRANADDGLILSVRDSGEGIAPVQLQLIREALQADVAYNNISSGGIGLGLSLAKELVSRHGGKVMVDSMRYRGSIVSLLLPGDRVESELVQKRKARRHLSVVGD